jgi:O-antigen ligase
VKAREPERYLGTLIAIGCVFVTIFVRLSAGTDPVNVTKLFALGGVALAVFFAAIQSASKAMWRESTALLILAMLFLVFGMSSVLQSEAPLNELIYGAYGRNTGYLTYVLLTLIMISTTLLRTTSSYRKLVFGLFAAGITNAIYCLWVLLFGDFLPWNNQYGKILGLFGNPNFISAFLGMFTVALIAYSLQKGISRFFRIATVIVSCVTVYEIIRSDAIQGLVILFGGLFTTGFFLVRSKWKSSLPSWVYSVCVAALGVMAILGTLQKGPFSFVYKKSVSLRGTYWNTGIEMGLNNPFSGVGFDAYGDWYRKFRPPVALIDTPPVNVITNAAHNVPIDLFASGGFPLLISYLGILFLGAKSILKITAQRKEYDGIFVSLAVIWIGYQVQSIISINQIGLAIWGWVTTGALVGYEKAIKVSTESAQTKSEYKASKKGVSNESVFSPQLLSGIGLIIGLLLAFPPINSDMRWRDALDSRNLQTIENALRPSYFNPVDTPRYAQAVQLMTDSKLPDQAFKYILIGLEHNPNATILWKFLYYSPNATETQKSEAFQNLSRLDPLNKNPAA